MSVSPEIIKEIIIAIASVLVACIPAYFAILPQLKNKKEKEADEDEGVAEIPELSNHPFFTRSEMIKNHILMTFTLENKGKEIVFKDILCNQVEVYQALLSELCERLDNGEIKTSNELYNAHIEAICHIAYKHYHYYKSDARYTEEDRQVLDKVMKKYVIWNKPKLDHIEDSLTSICNSPYYNDVHTQAAVIMDVYLGTMINTLNDAHASFNTINGDLRGLVFKGVTI